jgi:hypothetical protein
MTTAHAHVLGVYGSVTHATSGGTSGLTDVHAEYVDEKGRKKIFTETTKIFLKSYNARFGIICIELHCKKKNNVFE